MDAKKDVRCMNPLHCTNLHCTALNYIKKTKFVSHKQYVFSRLTSRNGKKTKTDQRTSDLFLLSRKRSDKQTCKSSSCKRLLSNANVMVKFALMNVSYSM